MREAVAFGVVLALITIVFATVPMRVSAPIITKITPSKGMVGKPAIIHGTDLRGSTLVIKFGRSEAQEIESLNDKAIKVTIPNKDARDPDPLTVTVTVDGVPAGEVPFSYKIIGAEPVVKNYGPKQGTAGLPVNIVIEGTDFTTPQGRKPDQIFLFGPDTIQGMVDATSVTAASFIAGFDLPPSAILGSYLVVIGFSDGSGVTAEGFFEVIA